MGEQEKALRNGAFVKKVSRSSARKTITENYCRPPLGGRVRCGTPGRARRSRVDEKDNMAWRRIILLSE
jgi:hypothetical protein